MHRQKPGLAWLPALLFALPAAMAFGAQPPLEPDWKKLETKPVVLNAPRQIQSAGAYDRTLFRTLTFPANSGTVNTGLPHGGMDKAGKPRPPILARYAQDTIWVDFDGDGKPGTGETRRIGPEGWSEAFNTELFYDDGSSSKYAFYMKTVVEKEKYAIVRACGRSFEYNGKKVTLLDDDGNANYNDAGRDSILVEGQPVCFIGKLVQIGDALCELIVHKTGATVEIRPAPKDTVLGTIDAFEKFDPPQKSENMRISTLVFYSPEGCFACDDRHRAIKVPPGAYDLVFGLIERDKETMYIKKGEKSSFAVTANEKATPKWGAKVVVRYTLSNDGDEVTVGPPHFIGQLTEEYVPDNTVKLNCTARLAMVFKDRTRFDVDGYVNFGSRRYDLLPDGEFKPIVFKKYRTTNDEYEAFVEYVSGIVGRVEGRERMQFIYKKKETARK